MQNVFLGNSSKPQGSWAQAAGKGLNPSLPPNSMNGSNVQNTASMAPETSGQHENGSSVRDRAEQEAKEFQLKAAFSEGWGQNVSPFFYLMFIVIFSEYF